MIMQRSFVATLVITALPWAAGAQSAHHVPAVAGGMPFSDNFNGKVINPGWTVSSLNPDSSVALTGKGYLEIKASPLNGGSDLFNDTNYNAPILLQPVSATVNWTIQTQFNFSPSNNYQGAGVLLATQPGNFTDSSQYERVAETAFSPNAGGNVIECPGVSAAYSQPTTEFKVAKSGSAAKGWVYAVAYSLNGKTWTPLCKTAPNTTAYTYVGLFTIRQPWDGNTSVYSVADFNYFNIHVKP